MNLVRLLLSLIVFNSGVHFAVTVRADDSFKITPDVVYGHKSGMALTFDVIQPKKPNGVGILFMMSGGWFSNWVSPDAIMGEEAYAAFPWFRDLADSGYTLFIVRHGSAPQFKVPEAVEDVRRAVRFIRLYSKDYGVDPARLGVCGGSAGGHLSLMLGTASDDGAKDKPEAVDRTSDRVAAVVAYYPPVDLREWVGPNATFPALEFDPQQAASVSPVLHVTPDDPPTLLIHGDKDELVKLNNSERIMAEFKKHNVAADLVVIEGAGHGFPGEQGQHASRKLVEWFDKHLAKAAVDSVRDKPTNSTGSASR